jgi:tetratricopeptide (TPR) repeat protein
MRRKLLDPVHPEIVRSLSALAKLHYRLGRLGESERLTKEALEITLKLAGPDSADVVGIYQHLGQIAGDQRRFAEAETLFTKGLEYQKRNQPIPNGDTASLLACIGRTLAERQRFAEAEPYYREALGICDSRTDLPPSARVGVQGGLGGVLVARNVAEKTQLPDAERQARFVEAEKLLLSTLEMIERSNEAPPEFRRNAIGRLIRLYTAWNDSFPDPQLPPKAASFRQKLAEPGPPPSTTQ